MLECLTCPDWTAYKRVTIPCSDFCPATVINVALAIEDPANKFTIPVIGIFYADGVSILNSLQQSPNTNISITIPGSGGLVASDRSALQTIYQNFMLANNNQPLPFNGYNTGFDISGGLSPWDQLISNTSYDPCLKRAYGIYCIEGRIVWINCNGCGASGPVPLALAQLTALQEIDFSAGNTLSGDMPCVFGNMTVPAQQTHLPPPVLIGYTP